MADPKKDIKDVNKELGIVEETLLSIADNLSNTIRKAIEGIRDESRNVAEIFEKNLQKSIKDIAKNSDAIVANQLKIAAGTAKIGDIEKQILNNNTKKLAIERTIENLKKSGVIVDNKTLELQRDALKTIDDQNKVLQTQRKEVSEIQKKLGTTGNVLKGIAKIPILGNLIDAEEALVVAQAEAAKNTSTSTSVMKTAFKNLGGNIKQNLTDPVTKFGLAVKFLSVVVKLFKSIDTEAGKTAKSIGMSYDNALLLNEELRNTAVNSKILGINFTEVAEAQRLLSEQFGTFNKISDNVLITQSQLTKLIGLSADEATKIFQTSAARGVNEDKFVKQVYASNVLLNAQNKTFLSEKVVLKDISTTSNAIKLSIKGGTDQLVKSVQEARKLGVSLNQLDQIAGSLLNFEESISAELEAELLTGKDLNLERARLYAINNDLAGVTREITAQGITSEKFSRMNRIQQEAIARSVGMTRESMADMFTEQKSLDELQKNASYRDVKSLKDAEEKFRKRTKEVGTAKALEELGESEFAQKQKTLSAQESFNEAMIRLGDIIKKVVDGPMGKMLSLINNAIDKILKIPGLDKLVGFVGGAGLLIGTAASLITIGKSLIGRPSGRPNDPVYTTGGIDSGLGGGTSTSVGKQAKTLFKNPKAYMRALGKSGKLLKIGGGLGSIAGGLALDYASEKAMESGNMGLGKGLDIGSSALTGAGLGATIGSVIPGIGTAVGAGVGGLLGAGYGAYQNYMAEPEQVQDTLIRPGQRPVKFAKGDIIMAGTNLGNNNETNDLLKELILAVKSGGNIYLDGNKVGTAMTVSTYRTQ